MQYDATRDGLYRPYTRPPLEAVLFRGKPDALCAELSRLAYFPFPPRVTALPQALADHGLRDVVYFEDTTTNTQAFAGLDGSGTAFVVFRGTESSGTMDLTTDAMFLPVKWDQGGRVHRGFANAYDSRGSVFAYDGNGAPVATYHAQGLNMRAALRQWVGQAGSKRIVASGHSLGAALATLFASDHGEAELVTIGSPRVGTRAFAQTFGERTVRRYVDCCDVVTTVPPAWIWFSHTQGEIYIDHAGKVRQPPIGAFDRLADQAAAKLEYVQLALGSWDTVKVRDLADHAPVNYVSAMLGIRQPI